MPFSFTLSYKCYNCSKIFTYTATKLLDYLNLPCVDQHAAVDGCPHCGSSTYFLSSSKLSLHKAVVNADL